MKRILPLLSALLFNMALLAQQDSLALVKGNVIGFNQQARQGETIAFEDLTDHRTYTAVSNADGKFELGLPFDRDYLIRVQGFQFDQEYAQITIPALKENQSGFTFNVTIEFDPPRTFTLNNVHFKSGSAELTKDSYTELKDLLDYLLMKPTVVVEVGGHTDAEGEEDTNMALSLKRARAVQSYLVKNGVKADQVVAKGYGETKPVATNDTPEGRQKNRRTEVKVISE